MLDAAAQRPCKVGVNLLMVAQQHVAGTAMGACGCLGAGGKQRIAARIEAGLALQPRRSTK